MRPLRLPLVAVALLATLAVALPGRSRAAEARADPRETLIAELTAQADGWDRAIVRKDRAAVEANMAEDFRHIDGAGNVSTKRPFVDELMSPDLEIEPYTVEDFDVRIYGDVALLCGRTRMHGRYRGEPFTSHYRYVDTYVRRDGEWRVVNVQITRMPVEGP